MTDYVFVYDPGSREFLLRRWIDDGAGPPAEADPGPGLPTAEAEAWCAAQRLRRTDPLVVERMAATSWSAVEQNFHGLYFY